MIGEKFERYKLGENMPDSCKWDGKTEEYFPVFPGGEEGLEGLQEVCEYIECGGSERFAQFAQATGFEVISNRYGCFVVKCDNNGVITNSRYLPICVNDFLHQTSSKHIANELIGQKLDDLLQQQNTRADADNAVY